MVNDERYVINMGSLNRKMQLIWIVLSILSILVKYFTMEESSLFYLYIIPEMIFIVSGIILIAYEIYKSSSSEVDDERTSVNRSILYYRGMQIVIFLVALGYTTSIILMNYQFTTSASSPNMFINLTMLISFIVYYTYTRKNQFYLFEKYLLENQKDYIKFTLKKISVLLVYTFLLIVFGFALYTILFGLNIEIITILLSVLLSGLGICFWTIVIAVYEWITYHEKVIEEDQGKARVLSKTYLIFGGWIFILSIFSSLLHSFYTYFAIHQITITMIQSDIIKVIIYLYYYVELTSIGRIFFIIISYLILYHSIKKAFPYRKHLHLLWLMFMFISLVLLFGGYFMKIFSLLSLNRFLIGFDFILKFNNIQFILNLVSSFLFIIILFMLNKTSNVSFKLLLSIIIIRLLPFLVSYIFAKGGQAALLSTSYLIVNLVLSIISLFLTFNVYYQLTNQRYTINKKNIDTENIEAIPV
ncbi:MAG: hypothetical protein AB7U79_00550 [Candidatus Izemoplasmatales bacterium]